MKKTIKNKNNQISLPVAENTPGLSLKETPPCIRADASYTVEAAVILPFFTGFMVALLFFFRVLQVQQVVQTALMDTGRELSVLAYEENGKKKAEGAAAKVLFLGNLEENVISDTFIQGGKWGISLSRSDFSGNYIDLKADYRMRLPIGFFGKQEIAVTQRLKCRKWIGSTGNEEKEQEDEIVYITPTGSAYHRDKNCSYLKPAVRQIKSSEMAGIRNESGGKYYACQRCMKKEKPRSMVYITVYGNRYHNRADCSELKRTVIAVHLSETGGRHACKKCGRE